MVRLEIFLPLCHSYGILDHSWWSNSPATYAYPLLRHIVRHLSIQPLTHPLDCASTRATHPLLVSVALLLYLFRISKMTMILIPPTTGSRSTHLHSTVHPLIRMELFWHDTLCVVLSAIRLLLLSVWLLIPLILLLRQWIVQGDAVIAFVSLVHLYTASVDTYRYTHPYDSVRTRTFFLFTCKYIPPFRPHVLSSSPSVMLSYIL